MTPRRATGSAVLAAGLLLAVGDAPLLHAVVPNEFDRPPNVATLPAPDVGPSELSTRNTPAREPELSGNPLWAVPLSSLPATRERPIFSPSRRPPPPAVAGAPPPAPRPQLVAPRPAEPDRPQLALMGTVAAEVGGIGVFMDETTRNIIRLKTGEGFGGWILTSIRGREATLQKDRETAILALPAPGIDPGPAAGAPGMAGAPGLAGPPPKAGTIFQPPGQKPISDKDL